MKTRNNQPPADETFLNQSITRRSFVKRGAVASAATVFGMGTILASVPGPPTGNPGAVEDGPNVVYLGVTYIIDPVPAADPDARPTEGIVYSDAELMALIPTLAGSMENALRYVLQDGETIVDLVPPTIESMDGFLTSPSDAPDSSDWQCESGSVTIRLYKVVSYFDIDPVDAPTPPTPPSRPGTLPLPEGGPGDGPLDFPVLPPL